MGEVAKIHPAIQLYGQSLPPQQRSKHRAWIGVRVEALLDPYWDKRPDDLVKREIMREWMDGLETFTEDEIRKACSAWNADARTRKPKVGNIREICENGRKVELAKAIVPTQPEQSDLSKQGVYIHALTPEQREQRQQQAQNILADVASKAGAN